MQIVLRGLNSTHQPLTESFFHVAIRFNLPNHSIDDMEISALLNAPTEKKKQQVGKYPYPLLERFSVLCVYFIFNSVIFWKSLEQSKYPENLKLSRINAIYKGKGSNSENYRPISVLSAVSVSLSVQPC